MIFITLMCVQCTYLNLQNIRTKLPSMICNFYALHKRPLSNMETSDCFKVRFKQPHDFGNSCIQISSWLFKNGTLVVNLKGTKRINYLRNIVNTLFMMAITEVIVCRNFLLNIHNKFNAVQTNKCRKILCAIR